MYYITELFNNLMHIDKYLFTILANHPQAIYWMIFLLLFCETGLIVTPFLPGDIVLFTLGSIIATANFSINITYLCSIMLIAAILGNIVNYYIGKVFGCYLISHPRICPKKYLDEAHKFYAKHGGMAIFFARFMPIVRTFVPFIAGIGEMPQTKFHLYNIFGAFTWILGLFSLGFYLGTINLVKTHFVAVIYIIVFFSCLPMIITIYKSKHQLS